MPDRSTFVVFPEQMIYFYVDLWNPFSFAELSTSTKETIRIILNDRLNVLLMDRREFGIRPSYFDPLTIENFLDTTLAEDLYTYFESQILFIIAKHCFIKRKSLYQKELMINDINAFYDAVSSIVKEKFLYHINWFADFEKSNELFFDQIHSIIINRYEQITTIISSFGDFDSVDDLFFFLCDKNNTENSLKIIYAESLGTDPLSSDDDALVFHSSDIVNDTQFSRANKVLSSYAVLNELRRVNGLNVLAFYNFYSEDESIPGVGDKQANSTNYYDLSSAYRSMPRYNKLTWIPIDGGAGINTTIVPVSGNISNISELQVANELYFSQEFRKSDKIAGVSLLQDYITICSSSYQKFSSSQQWSKINKGLINKETKDLIDNKIFVTDHALIRKRSEEQPRLQYVGYLITKYELDTSARWKLKEVIMIDDCATTSYYDFNVLYNKRYGYKIASLIKWVYSTSLTEVESFYSDAPADPDAPSPSFLVPPTEAVPIGHSSAAETESSSTGIMAMGYAESYEYRTLTIEGEESRADEDTRVESSDTLEDAVITTSFIVASALDERRPIR